MAKITRNSMGIKSLNGKPYDSNSYYWALMYKPSGRGKAHIVCLYPKGNDARSEALRINKSPFWEGKNAWSVKRFHFYFRGTEIDAYAHEFQRIEKKK